ncbi:hypothetical protein IW262DRAFT_1465406 [Armillaria fumosa]|nr:hypothetical protein IW262DRAFT_1465406 [Armillaria fumosa]
MAKICIGSHTYYIYLKNLVISGRMKGNPLKAKLYQSLEPLLSQFIGNWQDLDKKCASNPFFIWDTALSSSFMDFPDEIKMAIIGTMPCSDLLALCLVNKHLWNSLCPSCILICAFECLHPDGWPLQKNLSCHTSGQPLQNFWAPSSLMKLGSPSSLSLSNHDQ